MRRNSFPSSMSIVLPMPKPGPARSRNAAVRLWNEMARCMPPILVKAGPRLRPKAFFLYRLAVRAIIAGMERDGFARVERLFPMPLLREIRAHVLRRHESGELRRRGLVRDIAGRYTAVLPFEGPFLS